MSANIQQIGKGQFAAIVGPSGKPNYVDEMQLIF